MNPKKIVRILLSSLMILFLIGGSLFFPGLKVQAASPHLVVSDYSFSKEGEIGTGEEFTVNLTLTNPSAYPVRDLRVIANGGSALMLTGVSTVVLGNVASGASVPVSYGLTSSARTGSGYYYLELAFDYEDYNGIRYAESERIPIYLKGNEIAESALHPTLMLESYETNEEIYAGNDYELTAVLKNPTEIPIHHVKIGLQSEENAFVAKNGGGIIYLDGLSGGESTELKFQIHAESTLSMKTYQAMLKVEFEDETGAGYSESQMMYLPVRLTAQAELYGFALVNDNLVVGSDAEYLGSVSNTGRADIYQVKIKTGGVNLQAKEFYVGTLTAGASKNVDLLTKAISTDNSKLNYLTLTYQDVEGNVYTVKQELGYITVSQTDYTNLLTLKNDTNNHDTGRAVLITILVMLAITGIVVWQVFRIRKKNRILNEYK